MSFNLIDTVFFSLAEGMKCPESVPIKGIFFIVDMFTSLPRNHDIIYIYGLVIY